MTTRAEAVTMIADYSTGCCAARDGLPVPDGASPAFRDGHATVLREVRISAAGWDFKNGRLDAKGFAAAWRAA